MSDQAKALETIEFDYGITQSWLDEGRILVVKSQGDMRRDALDTWSKVLIEAIQSWDKDKPIASLTDLTHPRQGFTPYSKRVTQNILATLPTDRPVFSASVMRDNFINQFVSIFVRTVPLTSRNQKLRVFTNYDDALAWLRTSLEAVAAEEKKRNVADSSGSA